MEKRKTERVQDKAVAAFHIPDPAFTMEVEAFPGGTYFDGSALQSGISRDQTVLRALSKHDIAMRHNLAASLLTGVLWI